MDDNSSSPPEQNPGDQPWTIEADMVAHIRGIAMDEAIDLVIVRYLRAGDTRPLAWWLYEGRCPNAETLEYIACMLQPGSRASVETFPYELVAKSRDPKPGRPKKGPEPNLRDWLIYVKVSNLIEEHGAGSHDAAISEVASLDGLERPTVKRAYENFRKLRKTLSPDD